MSNADIGVDWDHSAAALWRRHSAVAPYPSGVIGVPRPILGTAFFPGGFGLWNPDQGLPLPPFPSDGVMILGHDFHSEVGYRESLAQGSEASTQPTWRNLVALLRRVGIAPEQCFFTNAYMGLRAGAATTGVFPGAKDDAFVQRCVQFLALQIAAQRPRLILTLGRFVPELLAQLSPDLADWRGVRSLRELDRAGAYRRAVSFDTDEGTSTNVVALTHPSLRHAGVRWRRYGELVGDEAEVAMLRAALSQ